MEPEVVLTTEEIMEVLSSCERGFPVETHAFMVSVLSDMPRTRYLGFIKAVERRRSQKGI